MPTPELLIDKLPPVVTIGEIVPIQLPVVPSILDRLARPVLPVSETQAQFRINFGNEKGRQRLTKYRGSGRGRRERCSCGEKKDFSSDHQKCNQNGSPRLQPFSSRTTST